MPPRSQSKRARTASSSRTPESNEPEVHRVRWRNRTEQELCTQIVKKGIIPTKYPDLEVLKELGLYNDVQQLFDNLGWGRILIGGWPVHLRAVVEMLVSCELECVSRTTPVKMEFQLNNERFEVHHQDINQAFNCPLDGHYKKPREFEKHTFWRRLVGSSTVLFKSGESKASSIRNPVFRMTQRILAHTLFARRENSSMRESELFVLWAMLTSTKLNFAQFLLNQFTRQALKRTGPICVGGMLTPIALSVCPLVAEWTVVTGDMWLSQVQWRDQRFLCSATAPYWFQQRDNDHFPLPNEDLTTVSGYFDDKNWLMNSDDHKRAIAVAKEQGGSRGSHVDYLSEEENDDDGDSGPHVSRRDDSGLGEQVEHLEHCYGEMNAQMITMRQDVTAIRLTQLEMRNRQETMEVAQRDAIQRQLAFQDAMFARQDAQEAAARDLMNMMSRFEASQISQGHVWPPFPPPS